MDTILIVMTVVSLALAAVMGGLLLRLLQEDRRRSDARVELLSALAVEPAAPVRPYRPVAPPAPARPPRRQDVRAFDDLDLHPGTPSADDTAGTLFHEHAASSPWPARLAVAAGLTMFLGVATIGWRSFDQRPPASLTEGVATVQPLELLSLAHVQENGAFTITGIVQNPEASATLTGLQATVLVFGSDGALLTTGGAPIDATTLRPGADSPFAVRIPLTAAAARYRVGFRRADGQALSHVDRRQAGAVARKETP